jgi:type VI secretion system protein ImpA
LRDAIDFDLAGSISLDQTCGPDLEYDAAFISLQQAAVGIPEQQFGDTLIPATAPDWRHVEREAAGLLKRTTDLRIIALITLAWTEINGLAGYARGLALTADVLEQHWDTLHPRLETAGEFDPHLRINALAALTDPQTLARSVRAAPLLTWKSAPLSLRDAAAILENGKPSAASALPVASGSLQAELLVALRAAHTELEVVPRLLQTVERIRRQILAKLDAAWVPDLSAIENPLRVVYHAIRGALRDTPASPPAAQTASAPPAPPAPTTVPPTTPTGQSAAQNNAGHEGSWANTPIRSRDDVLLALDSACAYLERTEPGHPAPLLIRRAQRLMHMNFYEIVRDMAPAALPQLSMWSGQPDTASAHLNN